MALSMPPQPSSSSLPTLSSTTAPHEAIETKIRRMLCPDLELELLGVTALQWSEMDDNEKEPGKYEASCLLESAVDKVLDAGRAATKRQNEEKERQAKNLNKFSCPKCKNKDQVNFREVEGSVICLGIDGLGSCGLEIINHRPHEGNFYRNFEGEEDRSHHGKPYDPLMSDQYNSRTNISIEGDVKGGAMLKAAHAKVEDDSCAVERDKDDRRTRDSYKDKHKQKAFFAMKDVAANLSLHARVVERAMWLFAMFRDDRDKVQRDALVWAACLVAAHRELAADAEGQEGSAVEDPAVIAERERVFREGQARRVREVEARNLERKRAREALVSAGAASEHVPVSKWDAARVASWVRSRVQSWTAAEVAASWGLKDSSVEAATALLEVVQAQAFVDEFVAKLHQPNRVLGQSLAIASAAKFTACCQGREAVATKLFEALKGEKLRDKEVKEANEKDLAKKGRK